MDNDDLSTLAAEVQAHGLAVETIDTQLRITNPLNSRLTEEISLRDGQYVTSFCYEVGEVGDETASAARIAHILAVGQSATGAAA